MLARLTDEEIRARFKDSSAVLNLRKKAVKALDEKEMDIFMKKYKTCPVCKAPIEKYDGYNFIRLLINQIII
jgi:hypothetical protein